MTRLRLVFALQILFLNAAANAAEPDGKAVYDKWCLACHRPDQVGTVRLQLKYNGSVPAVLTERTDIPPELVKVVVRSGLQVMPMFRKTEISDAELEALALFLSAARK